MPFESDNESADSAPHDIPAEIQSENFYFGKTMRKSRNSGKFAVKLKKKVVPIHVTNR